MTNRTGLLLPFPDFGYTVPVRIWSIHPGYLDSRGLVALWQEALLAEKVLRGLTTGYRNHPQLARFRRHPDPVGAIRSYLREILLESAARGFHFDARKVHPGGRSASPIAVTRGQLQYEWSHLKRKLRTRDPGRYRTLRNIKTPEPHPSFRVVEGGVEPWERKARH